MAAAGSEAEVRGAPQAAEEMAVARMEAAARARTGSVVMMPKFLKTLFPNLEKPDFGGGAKVALPMRQRRCHPSVKSRCSRGSLRRCGRPT